MPAAIPDETRSRIVFHAALGYSQRDIAEEVGVSRNTVRKYLRRAREAVEESEDPPRALADVVTGQYDWERPDRSAVQGFGDLPQ